MALVATLIGGLFWGMGKSAKANGGGDLPSSASGLQQILVVVQATKMLLESNERIEKIVFADIFLSAKLLHATGRLNWAACITVMGTTGITRLVSLWNDITVTSDAAAYASPADSNGRKDRSFRIEMLADHSPILTVRSQKSLPFLHRREHGPIPVKLTAKLPLKLAVQTADGPGTLTITSLGNGDATLSNRTVP